MVIDDDDEFSDRLEQAKRASMAQLLIRCARLVNERGLARASERLGVPVRSSHTALIPHIDLAGTRLTELARRVGVSKQAVGQLVGELEQLGVLCRVPDPEDGRAKLVRFTEQGQRWMLDGLAVLREIEDELLQHLGPRRMRALHSALLALLEVLEPG
ncbi:MAG: MarR family transcriptional regulator [Nannocystaceae bacterium]